jgi:protein-tyrosine kinase
MLIPKASHLAERVAERLLRSGALEDSAAQLLRQTVEQTPDHGQEPDAVPPLPAPVHVDAQMDAPTSARPKPALTQRSSIFAPPPSPNKPVVPLAMPNPLLPPTVATVGTLVPPAATLLPLTVPAQPRAPEPSPGQAGPETHVPQTTPSPAQRNGLADPAAGMLQGPVSIDAVSLERAGMVDWSRTRTRISEEFRLVQRQIIRSAFGPGAEPGFSNLLLVTSARPGEGKSFMSTNLAGSIARQGDHHVLLVDADSKRDSICYSLGLAQARGLLDLAANPKLDPGPLIVKTPIERLSILPIGRERERSAELFSTKEMTRLIQSLGRRYADRLLILDAPPCLSTSDPGRSHPARRNRGIARPDPGLSDDHVGSEQATDIVALHVRCLLILLLVLSLQRVTMR